MKRAMTIFLVMLSSIAIMAPVVFARAGGAEPDLVMGAGAIVLAILLAPFIIAVMIYSYIKSKMKRAEARKLLQKLAENDRTWNQDLLEKRAREVYFAVQMSWTKNDINLCRSFVSDRLFEQHRHLLAAMAKKGEMNILEQVQLDECTPLAVHDYAGETDDEVYIKIVGSMIDYTVDSSSKIVRGEKGKVVPFEELWVFCKHIKYGWVLNEIRKQIDCYQIGKIKSFTEEVSS
ncbi:MAG: Tim44 domain-containing protein [Geobacteraceae bacterium]|nr:Tim44 domain-containing protein [Geobacteraceae bacterium]